MKLLILLSLCGVALSSILQVSMPGAVPKKHDDYICTQIPLPAFENSPGYVNSFKSIVNDSVHHIILSGCELWLEGTEAVTPGPCDVQCAEHIMFAWAHNGAPMRLPDGAAFKIGKGTKIQSLNMEVHYIRALDYKDYATVEMTYSRRPTEFDAGVILMYNSDADIPQGREHFATNISCRLVTEVPIYVIAIRMHSHGLNRGVYGFYQEPSQEDFSVLAKGSAQWPETFYRPTQLQAASDFVKLTDGDLLLARCIFDSTSRNRTTQMGSTNDDEMCNLYLMFIIDARYELPLSSQRCSDEMVQGAWDNPPLGSFDYITGPPPPTPSTNNYSVSIGFTAEPHFHVKDFMLGQVPGVALTEVNGKNQLFIIQRGENSWTDDSFSDDFIYQGDPDIYVRSPILQVDIDTGDVLEQFGDDLLLIPHGLAVEKDRKGRPKALWLTDVALHQAMRFDWNHWSKPSLVLGTKMKPSSGPGSFCQPTDVAVASTGEVFVADGYCNQRIVKFSNDGEYLDEWPLAGKSSERSRHRRRLYDETRGFQIVHSLTIIPAEDDYVEQVCAADRERSQIDCYDLQGYRIARYTGNDLQPSVFAVAYNALYNLIFGVSAAEPTSYDPRSTMMLDIGAVEVEEAVSHGFAFAPFRPNSENENNATAVKRLDFGKDVLDIEDLGRHGLGFPHDADVSPDGKVMFVGGLRDPLLVKINIFKSNE